MTNPSALFVTSVINVQGRWSLPLENPALLVNQSLVIPSCYAAPRRASVGIDLNRAALIMAVLDKHAGISFVGLDTFINVVGGVRISEPAVDLTVACSLVSSLQGRVVNSDTAVIGEIGLTGEILPVGNIADRLREGAKLGYKKFIAPRANLSTLKEEQGFIELAGVENIKEAIDTCLL